MKKIEKKIKEANKKLKKLSTENHYESDALKTFANSVYTKIGETKNELAEIYELKNTLDLKKKKIEKQKSKIKSLISELNKLSDTASKELSKRKKKEKEQSATKEKIEKKQAEANEKKEKEQAETNEKKEKEQAEANEKMKKEQLEAKEKNKKKEAEELDKKESKSENKPARIKKK